MTLITVATTATRESGRRYCAHLERGDILLLPQWCPDDIEPLLAYDAVAGTHKNIAYDPRHNRVIGVRGRRADDLMHLRAALRRYSFTITAALTELLPNYALHWSVDVTSFRPCEEAGRALPLLQRNDLLHTDAFPSRPTNGARILRVFTNINPSRPRRWVTAEGFTQLVERFGGVAGFPRPRRRWQPHWSRQLTGPLRAWGLSALGRSPYDTFMLHLHDFLKTSQEYQAGCAKQVTEFPPRSSWVLFTDYVPHAALSGQFALEQTYIVPTSAMVDPDRSPVRILEHRYGTRLTHPESP